MKDKKYTMLGIKQYQRANITQSVPLSSWAGVYIIGIAPELTFIHTLIATQSSQKLSLDMLILGPQHFYVT